MRIPSTTRGLARHIGRLLLCSVCYGSNRPPPVSQTCRARPSTAINVLRNHFIRVLRSGTTLPRIIKPLTNVATAPLVWSTMVFIHKQTALATYAGGGAVLVDAAGGGTGAVCNSGSFFLGRFRSSNVMPPVSLVMPTTGGSPFLTNSHWPVIGLALDTETYADPPYLAASAPPGETHP